jgi:hypothetical protein
MKYHIEHEFDDEPTYVVPDDYPETEDDGACVEIGTTIPVERRRTLAVVVRDFLNNHHPAGNRQYQLPEFDLTITVRDGTGAITSGLHEQCGGCGRTDCDCPESSKDFNLAMDGIESLLVALACEGVDVAAPAFVDAIRTAVQACGNNL